MLATCGYYEYIIFIFCSLLLTLFTVIKWEKHFFSKFLSSFRGEGEGAEED